MKIVLHHSPTCPDLNAKPCFYWSWTDIWHKWNYVTISVTKHFITHIFIYHKHSPNTWFCLSINGKKLDGRQVCVCVCIKRKQDEFIMWLGNPSSKVSNCIGICTVVCRRRTTQEWLDIHSINLSTKYCQNIGKKYK